MSGYIANGATVTTRDATFLVVDCPCSQVNEDGDTSGALVLVECLSGQVLRHVMGRRVMMPAEQLRWSA